MPNQFWLYRWIDEEGIKSPDRVPRILADKTVLQRVQEFADADADVWEALAEESTNPIVAGRAIDLSGELDCNHLNCLKAKVDDLFRRVWHYFDEIVVEGLNPYIASRTIEEDPERALRLIEHHSKMLLYVRSIGAEELLVFRQKLPGCAQHYRKHLDEVGLAGLLEKSSWLIDRLAEDGEVIELKPHDDHWDYTFRHPMIEHFVSGGVFPEEDSADPKVYPQRAVAEAVFKKYSAHLVSDVHTAKRLSTPLAASVSLHAEVLDRSIPEAAEAEIALNLALPVLEDVPAAELIRVRQAEALSFERFRQSLRLAIQDRLTNSQATSAQLATEIVDDVVNPALYDIQQRLSAAEDVLVRKSAVSIGVGAISTTIGLIAGMPLLLPAGVAWALLPGQHYMKYLEEKRDIELSDMYFLWRQEHYAYRGSSRS